MVVIEREREENCYYFVQKTNKMHGTIEFHNHIKRAVLMTTALANRKKYSDVKHEEVSGWCMEFFFYLQ